MKINTKEPAWSQIKQLVNNELNREFNYAAIRTEDSTEFFIKLLGEREAALKGVRLIMDAEDGTILEIVPESVEAGEEFDGVGLA